ncbi:hypothetical protein Micbo1qcDRAFT_235894 [Microdochium bolleyi]|uniref:Uncharacterized protein n=1 Tax=Microdochium bolleyi TaxID=196109 RepID=A0A136IUM8_9PEZI|nr:hypothetical protein Micbo1qcDRAFT_235894 [Microdochium bolleyi]
MATTTEPPGNIKSFAIFGGYMATALLLTLRCISIIRQQSRHNIAGSLKAPASKDQQQQQQQVVTTTNPLSHAQLRRRVWIFSLLAAASLSTTWYYMFAFFAHSYRDWAATRGIPVSGTSASDLQLGAWLRDTSLFSQAWASAMATPPRVWWTQQIFGFCSLWTLILATEGSLRTGTAPAGRSSILTLWPFILLGQIVAISFAANLSFLAILLSGPRVLPKPLTGRAKWNANSRIVDPATFTGYAIVGLTFASVAATLPSGTGDEEKAGGGAASMMSSPAFLPLLLTPHVLAFAPLLLRKYIRSAAQLAQPSLVAVVMAILLQTRTTGSVLEQATAAGGAAGGGSVAVGGGMAHIRAAFGEHPAVSSVGWDVVLCWVSFTCWALLRD